jgi:hypothetical protein
MEDLSGSLGVIALILVGVWVAWRVARRFLRLALFVGLILVGVWLWRSGVAF